MDSPVINSRNTIWAIYRELLHRFEHLDAAVDFIEQYQVYLDPFNDSDHADMVEAEPPAALWRTREFGLFGLQIKYHKLLKFRENLYYHPMMMLRNDLKTILTPYECDKLSLYLFFTYEVE